MRWSKPQSAPHPMLRTRDLALPVMSKSTGNDGWAGPAQPVRQEGGPAAMRVEVVPPLDRWPPGFCCTSHNFTLYRPFQQTHLCILRRTQHIIEAAAYASATARARLALRALAAIRQR